MSNRSNSRPQVLIIAAEASSSLYAERLLQYWSSQGQKIDAFGVGSKAMEKLGFEILGRSEEMAVVGLWEVLAHWSLIKGVYHKILEEAEKRKPEFALLLDYPEFNMRIAKDLKARGIKVVYYISPQIWAWRTGRVKIVQKIVDRMLCIFPFEKDFYEEYGVPVDFVGHPLLDEIDPQLFDQSFVASKRERFGLGADDLVLGLMPGSRTSEINHHLRPQLEAAQKLQKKYPHLKLVLLVAPTLERDVLQKVLSEFDLQIQIIKDNPMEMIAITDMVLVASGTATLMVGLMQKPMVIMYKMNPITALAAKVLVNKTKFFGMANLIMNDRVVPELFQEQADSEHLVRYLSEYIESPEKRAAVRKNLAQLQVRLGARGATERVARILQTYFV